MKKKNYNFSFEALLISLCLLFFSSCSGLHMIRTYNVRLYDENNKQITDSNRIKEFNVTLMDNSTTKGYEGVVGISLQGSDNDPYYLVSFTLGDSAIKSTQNKYQKRFEDASKYMKIKVEDKKGEYKVGESSALSESKTSGKSVASYINIKLERK